MIYNAPVAQVIGERFALSFILLASAWLLSGLLGIMLGLTAGRYLHRWPDQLNLPHQLPVVLTTDVLGGLITAGDICRSLAMVSGLLCLGTGSERRQCQPRERPFTMSSCRWLR